jgi:hypothetical protein
MQWLSPNTKIPKLTALEKQSGDSTELTAMEKIIKLKTQWLNQLP